MSAETKAVEVTEEELNAGRAVAILEYGGEAMTSVVREMWAGQYAEAVALHTRHNGKTAKDIAVERDRLEAILCESAMRGVVPPLSTDASDRAYSEWLARVKQQEADLSSQKNCTQQLENNIKFLNERLAKSEANNKELRRQLSQKDAECGKEIAREVYHLRTAFEEAKKQLAEAMAMQWGTANGELTDAKRSVE